MEWMNKLIILIAICVLWFWSFLLLPKTRGESSLFLSFPSSLWFSHDLWCPS